MQKRIIKYLKWGAWMVALLFFFLWSSNESLKPSLPSAEGPPQVYATENQDDFRTLFVDAIRNANESILLVIYSLSDSQVIDALQEKADSGVAVKVMHDPGTSQKGFAKLQAPVVVEPMKERGLMHQKILVVDGAQVWIGSANFTTESLRLHDNLVVGCVSPNLAKRIRDGEGPTDFIVGGQRVEFRTHPEESKESFARLVELIEGAQDSIRVAMFTFTNAQLTEALVRAYNRGVSIEVVVDSQSAFGVSQKRVKDLAQAGISVSLSRGLQLFHHKFAYIDRSTLVSGSANWTQAAFTRNRECVVIMHDLTPEQRVKMDHIWHVIRATRDPLANEKHLTIFGERPQRIVDEELQVISRAA